MDLRNCDNMKLMAEYPDKYFDLAIVDPPYGAGSSIFSFEINLKNKITKHDQKEWNENKPDELYFKELFRVSKNQIVWGGNYFTDNLPISRGWIFWNKRYENMHSFADGELAWTSFDKNLRMFTFRGELTGAIHPTQKPAQLYKFCLKNYAKQNDKILDTHLGSGSIALAIDDVNKIDGMNLTLTACEIEKDYFDKAVKRIRNGTMQQGISFNH